METKTILLVGVGGQGTILAGDILAKTAVKSGRDVKISEIHGMSQRGGSVSTVVRIGSEVHSMIADAGCADVIVAFEKIEALRAQHFLKEGGFIFVNDEIITPVTVHIGIADLPEDVDSRLKELNAVVIDAAGIARKANNPKATNSALLGALSTALPFEEETWYEVIRERVPQKTIQENIKAFELGRDEATA